MPADHAFPPAMQAAYDSIAFQQALVAHDIAYLAEALGVEPDTISFVDPNGNPVETGGDLCLTMTLALRCEHRRRNFVVSFCPEEAPDARAD